MKTKKQYISEEQEWKQFFKPERVLDKMEINSQTKDLADFGCGYGRFAIPASKRITGDLYAFDCHLEMIRTIKNKAQRQKLDNIEIKRKDILKERIRLDNGSIDYVSAFNVLHVGKPSKFLEEAHRILKPGGKLGIIHWKRDPDSQGGTPLELRPEPEQSRLWAESSGFELEKQLEIEEFHYGLLMTKK